MKGWSKTVNRGKSGARKKQSASGDHSVSKVRQKKGPAAKSSEPRVRRKQDPVES